MREFKPDPDCMAKQQGSNPLDGEIAYAFNEQAAVVPIEEEEVTVPESPKDPFDRSSKKVNPAQVEAARMALSRTLELSSTLTDTTKFKGEKYEQTGTTWSLRIG